MNPEQELAKCQQRANRLFEDKFEYHHLAICRSNQFLRKLNSKKIPMFVLYVDLVGSTKMTYKLSSKVLTKIIRVFSQEMAYVIENHNGYVLKYVGDAVIGYFPAEKSPNRIANTVIDCSKFMLAVIKNVINPILVKEKHPKLNIKVSIDFGKNTVIRYGSDVHRSHIDIIGLSLDLAAKMQNIAKPNQIIIGKNVFDKVPSKLRKEFSQIHSKNWNFKNYEQKRVYQLYISGKD